MNTAPTGEPEEGFCRGLSSGPAIVVVGAGDGIVWKFPTRAVQAVSQAAHPCPPVGQGVHLRADAAGSAGQADAAGVTALTGETHLACDASGRPFVSRAGW
ncbi:hypothetical protein Srubr_20490 [Streptomyces rubradiris]|uniref:Uncharacterized protein n=1 Tax=Streptomyces rubradiris TaxID=285531 RepID=A0ABQ3R8M8_STRRR|nr:hypothetical protein GCM10018792_60230 [Streptomyces rubradiris]GHI52203.1 hypothetical protein Srubr_20490 [Streptomyces rubradiris]